jgi:hypothetical protein
VPKPRTTPKTKKPVQRAKPAAPAAKGPLKVKVVPAGPRAEELAKVSSRLLSHASVRKSLGSGRHRLLTVEPVEQEEGKGTRRLAAAEPVAYRATIYDYKKNQALIVNASVDGRRSPEVVETGEQPAPTRDEFDEAVRLLTKDPDLGPELRDERVRPYPPMPPLVETEDDTARPERTIAVGLLPAEKGARHEIVGVNLVRRTVVRFTDNAPETAAAHNPICGTPYTQQTTTGRQYVPGQAWVTVTQGGKVLWKFLVLRPAATQGPGRSTNGAGIELRSVTYRGKKLFHRAHVPILNVKYDPGGCGPYRDWQNEEGKINAQGADVAPGFRLCPQPAKRFSTPAQTRATSSASGSTSRGRSSCSSARWRPAGTGTSASGGCTPTGRSARASPSPPSRTPASATCTTTTCIGGSTSTFERRATTL